MSSGSKEMGFKVVEGWGKLPDGWSFGHVIGCAVDADDNARARRMSRVRTESHSTDQPT